MGTETQIGIMRINSQLLEVKLNNPLMGTETSRLIVAILFTLYEPVKLNNPLMGTETLWYFTHSKLFFFMVKLNNPLMGTETIQR